MDIGENASHEDKGRRAEVNEQLPARVRCLGRAAATPAEVISYPFVLCEVHPLADSVLPSAPARSKVSISFLAPPA